MKLKVLLITAILALSVHEMCLWAETAEFFYDRGRENFENGVYHLAMEDYDQALLLKPDYAEALNGKGEIYLYVREYADAEQAFSAAIRADSKYEKAYINRGRLYRIAGDYDKVIADWIKALQLNPNLVELKEELVDVCMAQGSSKGEMRDIMGAIGDLSLVCFLNPTNAKAWYRLGVLYLYSGDIAGAEACFLRVQRILNEKQEQNDPLFFQNIRQMGTGDVAFLQ